MGVALRGTPARCRLLAPAALAILVGACGLRGSGAEAFPELTEFAGREVDEVLFVDAEPFSEDTLSDLITTQATECRLLGLPICIPGTDIGRQEHYLNLDNLLQDSRRLAAFYRQSGFFGTTVEPVVVPAKSAADEVDEAAQEPEDREVVVRFEIRRGDPIILQSLTIEGVDTLLDVRRLEAALPLQEGDRFHLGRFSRSADSVAAALRARGHAFAEVLRNYGVDTIADLATAELVAIPGPVVRVDSIMIQGAGNLGRTAVLRQLPFGEGDLLRRSRLNEGQQNLFALDIVQFTAVTIAPDSLQRTPADSSSATVLVEVTEGPVHVVDAAVGYGSVSCFRTQGRWVSRSFRGGARRLSFTGRLSKIGIGAPLDFGLSRNLCRAFNRDPFGTPLEFEDELDYQFGAEFTRPYFMNPRNHISAVAFAERLSEPALFQREAQGGRVSVTRRFRTGDVGTISMSGERSKIDATTAIFCLGLAVCLREDIQVLLRPRWQNGLNGSLARDRTDRRLDPRSGYQLRGTVSWIAEFLGSDLDFVRSTADAARYMEIRPEWVLAGRIRLGTYFGTAAVNAPGDPDRAELEKILPPDNRFYAGGANSVRGFEQNGLGPGVWVIEGDREEIAALPESEVEASFVPVGGTSLAVTSVELRTPSPFLSDYLRLAAFVDAGAVGTQGLLELTKQWRITPGVGLRFQSPVGPVRLDLAYNPHPERRGPLFVLDDGELVRVDPVFSREGGFWDRLQFHVAVGHAF